MGRWNFWLAVIAGALVMYLLGFLPVIIGPLTGGFVAGLIARGDAWTGVKAGFAAGVLWLLLVAVSFVFSGPVPVHPETLTGLLVQPFMVLLLLSNAFFSGTVGAIGGMVGGILAGKGV